MGNLTGLLFWWLLYFVVHSLLADTAVKNFFTGKWHIPAHHYRKVYVLTALLPLIPVMRYLYAGTTLVLHFPVVVQWLGGGLCLWALYLFPAAWREYHLKSFIGLEPESYQEFVTGGMHRCVRHPLYSVSMLLLAGVVLLFPTLSVIVSAVAIVVYLFIGTWLEERKLIAEYGQAYREYKKQVPMFFPKSIKCFFKYK